MVDPEQLTDSQEAPGPWLDPRGLAKLGMVAIAAGLGIVLAHYSDKRAAELASAEGH